MGQEEGSVRPEKDKSPGESLQCGCVCWCRSTLTSLQRSAPAINSACLHSRISISFSDISPGNAGCNNTTFV